MAYKYEVEQKAAAVKIRVLIAVYVMFVVSAILIGIAVRLQQLQSIRPVNPSADTASSPSNAATSISSDPSYNVKSLKALAYCAVVTQDGQRTGERIPLSAMYHFKQIRRDIGQTGDTLAEICSNSAYTGVCNWKTINDSDARCRNGLTIAQCSTETTTCDDGAPSGALWMTLADVQTTATNYVASYSADGAVIYDNNEVDVILNTQLGDVGAGSVTRNGITYTLDRTSLQVVDTSSLFPIYNWRCNNDVCTTGTCQNGSLSYTNGVCTFNTSTRQFQCPTNKYVRYDVLTGTNKTFYYNLTNTTGAVNGDNTWVRTGYAYDSLADASYDSSIPTATDNAMDFRGNVVKYEYLCTSNATPTVTPTPIIDARKTGPVCVERVAPNNEATFTITVVNNGTESAVINNVDDALPQGFTYKSNSTRANGVAVSDSYVTTVNSGSSQKVTFAPPTGQTPWTLNQNQTMVITFTAIAGTGAITGTNTNRVVVVVEGTDAIDDTTYQFEVEQTCNPDTGLFDEPLLVFALSGAVMLLGFYVLLTPQGTALVARLGSSSEKLKKQIRETGKELEEKADPKRNFEKRVLNRTKK